MDARGQATRLSDLTRAFYERTHDSFSATRQSPWRGWDELWNVIGTVMDERSARAGRLRIADIACGNLRFVRFLQQKTEAPLEVDAFDGCEPLVIEGLRALSGDGMRRLAVQERICDIAKACTTDEDFMAGADPYDLMVAFGFLHHLPLLEQRERLLRLMADHVSEGGFLTTSFWQFAHDARLLEKAETATQRARQAGESNELGEGDYLLGWQDDTEAFRFCHHFTDDEIDALSASLSDVATEVTRFSADGKSGDSNRYVVWRRHG